MQTVNANGVKNMKAYVNNKYTWGLERYAWRD